MFKTNLSLMIVLLTTSTFSFSKENESQTTAKKFIAKEELLIPAQKFYNNKIENLLNIKDSYVLYNEKDIKIEATRKSEAKKKDSNLKVPGSTELLIGSIYSPISVVNNLDDPSKWQLININSKGNLIISGLKIDNNPDFKNIIKNYKSSDDLDQKYIKPYLKDGNLEYINKFSTKLDYSSKKDNTEILLEGNIKLPKNSIGVTYETKDQSVVQDYNYKIQNVLYQLDYNLLDLSTSKRSELSKLTPENSPIYISRISYGNEANLKISTNLRKEDLSLFLNAKKGNLAEIKAKYNNNKITLNVSVESETYGIDPYSLLDNTDSIEEAHTIIKNFESGVHKSMLDNKNKLKASPIEIQFKNLIDNTTVSIGQIYDTNINNYQVDISGMKQARPYITYFNGFNVKTGRWSNDSVKILPVVNYVINYNDLKNELLSIEDINISNYDKLGISNKIGFKNVGAQLYPVVENYLKDIEKKVFSKFSDNEYIYVSNYKNGQQPIHTNDKYVQNNQYLNTYPVFGEFISIDPLIWTICQNSAFVACEDHTEFKYSHMDYSREAMIYRSSEAEAGLRWVEIN